MATAEYMREWRKRHDGSLPPGDPRHGTRTGYDNWRCRCAACKRANADAQVEYHHRKGSKQPLAVFRAQRREQAWAKPCGSEVKYKLGCRCSECRTAAAAARRRRRAAHNTGTRRDANTHS